MAVFRRFLILTADSRAICQMATAANKWGDADMKDELEGIEPLVDSVDVAAARMGIGRVQLYREVKAGRLELRKVGRRSLVTRVEQLRWVAALPVARVA